jgi:hypothetical protein
MSALATNTLTLLAALVVGLISGFYWEFPGAPTIRFASTIAGISLIATIVMVSIVSMTSPKDELWRLPGIRNRDKGTAEPLQRFWLASLCLIALGVGNAAVYLLTHENAAWVLLIPAGAGTWVGVRVAIFIYQKRIDGL